MKRERNRKSIPETHLDLFGKKFCDGSEFKDNDPHTKFPKNFFDPLKEPLCIIIKDAFL